MRGRMILVEDIESDEGIKVSGRELREEVVYSLRFYSSIRRKGASGRRIKHYAYGVPVKDLSLFMENGGRLYIQPINGVKK